jgi:uncharacterized OsmC-like protein
MIGDFRPSDYRLAVIAACIAIAIAIVLKLLA